MLLLWYLFAFAPCVLALVNVTIDDATTNITYFPPQAWQYGPPCSDCTLRPDPTRAHNGTWHVGTFEPPFGSSTPPWASLKFHGSAVYVYCILSRSQNHAIQTDLTFYLDHEQVGTFTFHLQGGEPVYDFPVYVNNSLPMADHTLVIQNGREDGDQSSVILDYIKYSTDETHEIATTFQNSSTNQSSALTGALIALCILFAGLLTFFLYRLWKTKRGARVLSTYTSRNDILPTSGTSRNNEPFLRRWFTRFHTRQKSIAFNPSLLARRRQLQSDSSKDLLSPAFSNSRPQSAAVLAPDDPESRKPAESRWASVMSWRDRTVREGEIPSLPPTSHAPTTIFSGPAAPGPGPLQIRPTPNQQHQQRKFTVMNG